MHREARMEDALVILERRYEEITQGWKQKSEQHPNSEIEQWLDQIYQGNCV